MSIEDEFERMTQGRDQARADQLNAGFRSIVQNLREFYDLCREQGFTEAQAFDLTRDIFAQWGDRYEPEEENPDD